MELSAILTLIALFCYTAASLAIFARLFHPHGPNKFLINVLGAVGVISHLILLVNILFSNNAVNFSLPNVLTLVTLVITLCIAGVSFKYKISLLLPIVYGFTACWLFATLLIPASAASVLASVGGVLLSHITIALAAYCVLIIATLYAFQVSYINFKLKSKDLLSVSHLPPLMQVEGQLFVILAVGTLGLLLSEATGFVFLDGFFTKENAHKTALSLVALIIYSVTLWGHYSKGWRGHRVLILTIIGSFLLTLSYFGSRFVKEFLL